MAPKRELVRIAIAARDGATARAVLDRNGTMPGRGAYLCLQPGSAAARAACLQRALRRRAIPRALRASVGVGDELLESVGQ